METTINLAGFQCDVSKAADGCINFNGSAKVLGQRYFAMIKVNFRSGAPKVALGDYRVETFTGKGPRGAANVKLEDMMANAREQAIAFSAAIQQVAA